MLEVLQGMKVGTAHLERLGERCAGDAAATELLRATLAPKAKAP